MRLFLDTTIQIDRIFGSRKKRNMIREICAGKECCCTTYVLGEFYATIMRDVVTVYSVLLRENDLNEAERYVAELARNRTANRTHKIFIHLRELYDNDLEKMKCEMESYFEDLLFMFYRGVNATLSDRTHCQRGKAQIKYYDRIPVVEGVGCRKTDCHCDIERFWTDHCALLADMSFPDTLGDPPRELLAQIREHKNDVKGNSCRTLGDSIIVLEARDNQGDVCSTNQKDFLPLCEMFQVKLYIPQL